MILTLIIGGSKLTLRNDSPKDHHYSDLHVSLQSAVAVLYVLTTAYFTKGGKGFYLKTVL